MERRGRAQERAQPHQVGGRLPAPLALTYRYLKRRSRYIIRRAILEQHSKYCTQRPFPAHQHQESTTEESRALV